MWELRRIVQNIPKIPVVLDAVAGEHLAHPVYYVHAGDVVNFLSRYYD